MTKPPASKPDLISPARFHPPTRTVLYALLAVLIVGFGLRFYPTTAFRGVGFDESLYRDYVLQLNTVGIERFSEMVAKYIEMQQELPSAILPPTRFLYIFTAHLWSSLSGTNPLAALHDVSAFFSALTLLLATLFAWRLKGPTIALGVATLMACAPTQIHMAQHALIDGFFAFWALMCVWLLWECFERGKEVSYGWLASLGACLALLVLCKENSFFVYVGLLGVTALAPWAGYGKWSPKLLITLVIGPALGLGTLIALSGGIAPFVETYSLLVEKAYQLEYAIKTGDGPWYRYLVDLLLISPLVLLLAIGSVFRLERNDKNTTYLVAFVVCTYLIMCNIKYGMNLRYTVMWDMPLRFLALSQVIWLTRRLPKYQVIAACTATAAIALYDLYLYRLFFALHPLYELVTGGLLHVLKILK